MFGYRHQKILNATRSECAATRALMIQLFSHLQGKIDHMALNIDDILPKLQAEGNQIDGVTSLLGTINGELKDAIAKLNAQGANTNKLQAISDMIDTNDAKLAKAVVENPDPGATPAPTGAGGTGSGPSDIPTDVTSTPIVTPDPSVPSAR
jgi:hypothetical protein